MGIFKEFYHKITRNRHQLNDRKYYSENVITPTQTQKISPSAIKIISPEQIRMIRPIEKTSLDDELKEYGFIKISNNEYQAKMGKNGYHVFIKRIKKRKTFKLLIKSPPKALLNGPHHYCFSKTNDKGLYNVHFCKGGGEPISMAQGLINELKLVGRY